MASGDNEPAKLLLPYLQRADELQKHEPLVAYYCRLYAMERGLSIPQADRTKTTNAILVSLMKQLEKDKKSLKLGPDDQLHVEGFALNIFARADKQDRAGRADLTTAKTFYAASIFFEILNQFGELQPDLEQKQKYAAWKAADIRKAMKEGRKPEPGPPLDESGTYDLGPSRSGSAGKVGAEFNTSPHFDKNQLSMNNLQSPHFNDVVNNHQPASIPPPSPSYPTSSYSSQDFQLPSSSPHSSHYNDKANDHQSTTIPPTPPFSTANYSSQDYHPPPSIPQSSHYNDEANDHRSTTIPITPPFSAANYSSQDFQAPPAPTNRSENSNYSQSYHHLPHSQEPQNQVPQNYHPYETSPYSYTNFQTYPSFTESSLPTAPTHYPSFQPCSEASFSPHSTLPSVVNGPSSGHNLNSTSRTALESAQSAQSYQYDCNYQPPPEKIADAHKAARFAVGALAFDDVPTAVDHLRKSLELLTNPSAGY